VSKIVAAAAIRGARKVVGEAEEFLNKAIKEKGRDQKVEFPETAFFLPMAYALLGIEVRTLGDIMPVLEEAKSLLRKEPSDSLWLPYLGDALDSGIATLLGEEIIVGIRYLYGQEPQPDCVGFYTDTWMRSYGIQLVDGRMPGFAAILGAAPDKKIAVEIVRELQKRNIICFVGSNHNGRSIIDQLKEENVQMGWETYIVPYGRDTITGIYPLNWAIRAALTFGGLKKGEALKCLKYCQNRVFAFGLVLGEVDDVKYATGAGAINMGFPIIADTDIPEIRPTGICTYEHLVKELDHKKLVPTCIQVRGVKVKVTEIPIPVAYSAAFEGETVRKEQMHVQFGGKYSTAFEYVTTRDLDEVEDGKIEVIGPEVDAAKEGDAMPLGIYVEVAGRKMQKDFEPILERQIHTFLNEAMGIFHMGQRDLCWLRISKEAKKKGFKIRHFGVIIHARLHDTFGAIVDKAQVTVYTRQEDVERYLPEAKKAYNERDERMAGMTDESVDTFYSCTLCVPKGQNVILSDGSFKRIEDLIHTVAEEKDLQALSFKNPFAKSASVGELFLNPAPRYIQRIFLNNGNQIELTTNHKILIDRKDGLKWVEARGMVKGDRVIVPKCTDIDGIKENQEGRLIIDFLPDDMKVFDENFLNRLKGTILERYKKFAIASRKLGIDYHRIYSAFYFNGKCGRRFKNPRFSLREIREICEKLNWEWNEIKKDIRIFGVSHGQGYILKKLVLDEDIMYLAGLVASDGCVKYRGKGCNVQFTNSEVALIQSFTTIVNSIFGIPPKKYIVRPTTTRFGKVKIKGKSPVTVVFVNNTIVGRLMQGLGIGLQKKESVKWLGHQISNLPNNLISAFLRGLFDGDGHVTGDHLLISTGPYKEAQHIYLLLKKLGIDSYITNTTRGYQVGTRNFSDYIRFRDLISCNHPRKRKAMYKAKFSFDVNHVVRSDTVPFKCGDLIENLLLKYRGKMQTCKLGIDYKTIAAWRKKKCRASKGKLRLFLDEIKEKVDPSDSTYQELLEWTESNVNFDKVRDIKLIRYKEREVYNFSVDQFHNYLINAVVVKNCQSFAPNHVCMVKPERLGLCGAYTWLDARACFELNPTGPNQPVKKGEFIDPVRGEWRGVNEFIYQKSNKTLERFHGYSIMTHPETSCCVKNTELVIDEELVEIGEFIDKHRGREEFIRSAALTLSQGKGVSEKIVAMQKFNAPEMLYRLKTKSGTEIILTPGHEFAVDMPQGLRWMTIEQIEPGSRVIALKKLDLDGKLPNIIDFIPDEFGIRDEVLIKTTKNKLLAKYGSLSKAFKKIGLKSFNPRARSLTIFSFKKIMDVLGQDWNVVKRSINTVARCGSLIKLPKELGKDLFYLMGLIASDGCISRFGRYEYRFNFVNTNEDLVTLFKSTYEKIFPGRHVSIRLREKNLAWIKGRKINSQKKCFQCQVTNPVWGVIAEHYGMKLGLQGTWNLGRMLNLPEDHISSFVAGIFDGDGSVRLRKYNGKWKTGEGYICIADKRAASHLQLLLKRLGIVGNIRKSGSVYKIVFYGKNLLNFSNLIPSKHPEKRAILNENASLTREGKIDKTQEQVLPFSVGKALSDIPGIENILSPSTYFYYRTGKFRPVTSNVERAIDLLPQAKVLRPALNSDYFLDIVTKIEKVRNRGEFAHVYNLTLANNHSYFANGLLIKNCGCFECIIAILPEANGFMIVNREYGGMTPIGMTFSTLAGSVGGGAQTPGFMGIGRLYIVSRKFISADGGIRRIVWMTKELKEALGDKFKKRCEEEGVPDLIDKIADESVAGTTDELLSYLKKVNHPALGLEPLV